ncbi:MAG: hypothetical protein HXX81_02395 [Campylobacterales bacterium]|nr:hypothetical protein [Campylobacterales bacterium]
MSEENPWQKRFERERRARKEAEMLLESKSLELWNVNQNLEKTIHERTESLELAVREANRANESKSMFLANMSHEIRTPINAILGFSNILLDMDIKKEQREYLEIILASTKNLLDIVNDILDFSKIENDKLELEIIEFEPNDVFSKLSKQFIAKMQEKSIDFVVEIDDNLPKRIFGDALRLSQIIANLLSNAFKFTPNGGRIIFSIKLKTKDIDFVEIEYSVSDNGIGIPKDKQQLIFKPFTQADSTITRKYGGTGLGLCITTSLIKKMGSEISLESEENSGSRFYFTIKHKIAREVVSNFYGFKVLLAENHVINQKLLKAIFNKRGVDVEIINSSNELLDSYFFKFLQSCFY